ncbi:bilin-binding protein-like [Nymphalis io]|uniref:bilin-binding protein-like n=1 Tax=Inachis io TaxID=171585 RepID=UPI0021682175|nr:bilin-binding protein-like [Nymphalis io]
MFPIIILALVASVTANVIVDSQCPDPKPVENFNFAAFGQGTWYELARYSNNAEKMGKCGRAEYVREGDVIKVKNVHIANNKLASIEGTAKLADDAGNTGKLVYTLPYGPSGAETKNVLNILATDYENYAIGYHCKYDEAKKTRQDFAWVLSRTKTLDETVKNTVENFIKESKILDLSKFTWPDFSEVACKVNYGNGVWYEVAKYPHGNEKKVKCGSAEYKLEGDVIKVKNTYIKNNKLKVIQGTAKLATDAGTTGKLVHSMPFGAKGAVTDSVVNILSTDYDNYCIAYFCQFDENKKARREFAWVFSRSKTLSDETKATIEKFIKDSTLLNASKFVWPSFTDEDCRVDA